MEAGQVPRAGGPNAFEDRTRESGIDFAHFNGMWGKYYILEILGPGAALFDYDNDGDLDLYLVQGAMLGPSKTIADAVFPPPKGPLTDRLYRNDLAVKADGSRTLRFTDVTAASGIAEDAYGMGVATGDFDNDGWIDLYVTNYGSNRLLRNKGDGTFADVTRAAGADDPRWSTAASFVDYDRDGLLDLFVANYLDFTYANHVECRARSTAIDYCGPQRYKGVPDRLFRNRGNGTFEDVGLKLGIGKPAGKGLGVVAADFDRDGWVDLYVANDGEPNFLWMNQQGRGFEERAVLAGSALNREGQPEASMGVDAGDYDGDGDDDLFMTHITNEKNTLYTSLQADSGELLFEDRSFETGLATPSLPLTGFGARWLDYDNDGWIDIPVVNGAVYVIDHQVRAKDPYPLRQRKQLFRNMGNGRFSDVTDRAGPAFQIEEVSRGLAVGDLDNDGDADMVVTNSNGPARVLLNQVGTRNRWVGLRLVGGTGPRDMLGARVTVTLATGRALARRAYADGSYLSANDPRVLVGLGTATAIRAVVVDWPDGSREQWRDLPIGRYHTLHLGKGTRVTR